MTTEKENTATKEIAAVPKEIAAVPKDAVPKESPRKRDGLRNSKGQFTAEYTREQNKDRAHQQLAANAKNSVTKQKSQFALNADYFAKSLVDMLTQVDPTTGSVYIDEFIKNTLDIAVRDPESRPGMYLLQNGVMSPAVMERLTATADKTRIRDEDFAIYQLRKTLFDKQIKPFDNDFSKKMVIICSRRAGKTELNARKIIKACLKHDTPVLYLNKTFDNAISQMWDLVMKCAEDCDLAVKTSKKTDGIIQFTNGSSVKFGGVNDIAAIDKYRGFKFKLVIVDEVGHIKNGQYLIDDVLTPATADFSDSQMVFTGTPPRVKNFATRLWDSNVKKYHWTAADNPFVPDFAHFIEEVCAEKGLTKDSPFIQREYYGNMHAYDTDAVVFRGYKTYDFIPKDVRPHRIYIGVDFGFVDYNGVVSVLVDNLAQKAYVIKEDKFNLAGNDKIAAVIVEHYLNAQKVLGEYGFPTEDINGMIWCVTDTNAPALATDLHDKYKLPNVVKAYKYDKAGSINELATEMRTGRLLVLKDGYCAEEAESVVWQRDELTDRVVAEIDDDVYHPDILDALRYASRIWLQEWTLGDSGAHNIPIRPDRPEHLQDIEQVLQETHKLPPTEKTEAFVSDGSFGAFAL